MKKLNDIKTYLNEHIPSAHIKMDISGEVYPNQKKDNPKFAYAFKCDIPFDLKTVTKTTLFLLSCSILLKK